MIHARRLRRGLDQVNVLTRRPSPALGEPPLHDPRRKAASSVVAMGPPPGAPYARGSRQPRASDGQDRFGRWIVPEGPSRCLSAIIIPQAWPEGTNLLSFTFTSRPVGNTKAGSRPSWALIRPGSVQPE